MNLPLDGQAAHTRIIVGCYRVIELHSLKPFMWVCLQKNQAARMEQQKATGFDFL